MSSPNRLLFVWACTVDIDDNANTDIILNERSTLESVNNPFLVLRFILVGHPSSSLLWMLLFF